MLLLAGLAVLPGCGGGGEGPSRPASRIAPAGPEPGENPAAMPETGATAASVRAASVLGSADALFATSVHEESGFGAHAVRDVACSGPVCSGIGTRNAGRLAEAGVVGRTGGIDLVSGSDMDAASWGGWMRHAGFGVLLERAPAAEDLGGLREFRYGLVLGALTE
ncbi:MAG: hypothetical protein OXH14_19785, partial [Alphaproteobacteria bacterium]|nr:hypothetical protein [Alphaproteobacteria bacterium]